MLLFFTQAPARPPSMRLAWPARGRGIFRGQTKRDRCPIQPDEPLLKRKNPESAEHINDAKNIIPSLFPEGPPAFARSDGYTVDGNPTACANLSIHRAFTSPCFMILSMNPPLHRGGL